MDFSDLKSTYCFSASRAPPLGVSVGTAVFTAANARLKAQQNGRSGSGWDYEMSEWAEEKVVGGEFQSRPSKGHYNTTQI